ncbi:MAG: hypothetical protein WC209_14825 [Ignavibacteriaceae bacterium]|jgi:uncharacterized membrane protein (DUF106 family)
MRKININEKESIAGKGKNFKKTAKKKQLSMELMKLTSFFIIGLVALWYFVSSFLANIIVTAVLVVLYFVLAADVVDYNKALENVNRKVSEFKNSEKDALKD